MLHRHVDHPDEGGLKLGLITWDNPPKKKYIYDMMVEQKEDMIENAKKILKVCSGETEEMKFKHNEMVFYGRDGFYPNDVNIRSGEKII